MKASGLKRSLILLVILACAVGSIALFSLLTTPGSVIRANPKGDFISLETENRGSTITLSISPSSPDTFFSFETATWELNFIEKTDKNYTFEVRYLKDDKVIATIRKTLPREKTFDFEIPKGQKFHAYFSAGPLSVPEAPTL